MNSAAAAMVSAAAIASLLGVYSAAVGSEVRIAGEAADMIASMAAASNEALSAAYDAETRSVVVRNHGHAPARLYMADIVAGAGQGGAGGVKVRVALAPEGYAAPPGMAVVNGTVVGAAAAASREIAPGAAASIPLGGALAAASAAASAAAKGGSGGIGARIVHPGSAAVTTDAVTRIAVGGLPAAAAAAGSVGAGNGSGGGAGGTATINGMGINSRIVHEWHGGFAVSGSGTVGAVSVPAGPYVEAGGGADGFAGVVLGGDPSSAAAVPSLSGSYSYSRGPGGSLALGGGGGGGGGAGSAPSPLPYASKRDLEGSPAVSRDGQGLHLRGPGRVLLELAAYEAGSALFLSGSASGGAELFVGSSPYGLASQAYSAGRGFEVWRGQAAGPSHSRFDSPCPPSGRAEFSASYWWDVPSVPAGLRGRASHGASAAANNNLPDPATGQRGEPLMPASARIEYGPGGGGLYGEIVGLSMQSGSSPHLNGPAGCRMRPAGVLPSIYDEVPIAESLAVLPGAPAYGRFEAVLPAPGAGEGGAYVLAHLDGPAAAVSLSARQVSPGEALLSLRGLPPSVPYRIASGGETLAAGVTSGAGGVDVAAADLGPGGAATAGAGSGAGAGEAARPPGAVLHLYADSFAVRGRPAAAVAYDPLHGESFAAPPLRAGTVYVVHAWARIPVVGQANVSGAALNGTLPLPFVDGARGANGTDGGGVGGSVPSPEYVHVPIVPGYTHAAMEVNGVRAALAFADAAGGGGGWGGGAAAVRILPPSSSAQRESGQGAVLRASAQAGASSAHVAPRDGALGAVFSVQASGSVRIDNTYALRGAGGDAGWRFNASAAATGPPPGWPPAGAPAPVSAHVYVRVNGEPAGAVPLAAAGAHGIGGQGYSSSAGAGSVLESVEHRWDGGGARGSASVPVRAGDLVEFTVAVNATAAAPPYSPPAGAEVARAAGSASAEASILSGTIIAGM